MRFVRFYHENRYHRYYKQSIVVDPMVTEMKKFINENNMQRLLILEWKNL